MPIQRRLPKFGFTSRMATRYAEVRLHELRAIDGEVNPASLIDAGIVPLGTETVKIILSGEVSGAFKITGCRVTKGARAAIEGAGGSVTDPEPKAKGGRLQKRAGSAEPAPAPSAAPAPTVAEDAPTAPENAAGDAASDGAAPADDAVPAADAAADAAPAADDDAPAS